MASPQNVNYRSSGGTIYGGRTKPPSWVPAPGTVADISLNTMFDVRGSDVSTGAIFKAWSGCAFAPWWGRYGSLIFTGGGHGDSAENAVFRYDVFTRLVSKIKPSAAWFQKSDGYVADTVTGWMWANSTPGDTSVQVGEPFTAHFYSTLLALPEKAFPGQGGSNGWLYTPGRIAMYSVGQVGTWTAHKLKLGLETQWSIQGPINQGGNGEYGYAVYDSLRNRVWYSPSSTTTTMKYRDLTAASVGSIDTTGGIDLNSYYAVGGYHTSEDLLMFIRSGGGLGLQLRVVDPVTRVAYQPATSGPAPSYANECAWDWSDAWNAWVCYPADGTNTIWFLKAPSDPRTGTWVWSSQTVSGMVRSNDNSGGPAYNRLRHCPALGNVLLWAPLYNAPIQAIAVNAP